jgi:bifunctional non-homologous end joining protein LigD
MVLRRMPEGITGPSFYQKNARAGTPSWVRTVKLWSEETDRWIHYMVVDDVGTLLHVIQLGCISLSPWSSRIASIENPDFSILDLDPGDDCSFEQVIEVAILAREILDEMGLRGYAKTSGATGIHVAVPLEPVYTYEDARVLAEVVAREAGRRRPDLITTVRTVKARPQDKVYFDYLQNVPGKTVASVYSVRERPLAPVSTPLRWDEVKSGLRPEHFTIENFAERIAKVGDLWRPVLEDRQGLPTVKKPPRRRRGAA